MSFPKEILSPILPRIGKRNILITSALPYVNNYPHLGNIVGSVLSADVYSRYCKARGYPTLYICGTDDYGTATETKAIEERCTPQELCDKYRLLHARTYEWFNISFDYFGQTSTEKQTIIAQDIFSNLWNNGFLEEKTTIQPYCEEHGVFLADRFIEGTCPLCGYEDARGDQCDRCGKLVDALDLVAPRCKLDNAKPVPRETRHIFIRLDKLQPDIETWFRKSSADGAWSSNSIGITSAWLREGLQGRSITRDLRWGTGVPLPGYEDKCLYSWFDACIGYISITASYTDEWRKWWHDPNVQLYQFMGKDNVPFHNVMFPGSLIGTGENNWTMLHHISATEYLNYEKGKFSKSRNVGVFGINAKDTDVPSDVWRYYLISRRPEGSDTEFDWGSFIAANNNELLKNLGNFVNRTVKFIHGRNYSSIVPDYKRYTESSLHAWVQDVNNELGVYIAEFEAVKLKSALACVLNISSLGNKLLQMHHVDNKLAVEEPYKCAAIVGLAINLVHLLSSLVEPFLPVTSTSILRQLNLKKERILDTWNSDLVPIGHEIQPAELLFKQIPISREEEWREKFGGEEARKQRKAKAMRTAAQKAYKQREKHLQSPTVLADAHATSFEYDRAK